MERDLKKIMLGALAVTLVVSGGCYLIFRPANAQDPAAEQQEQQAMPVNVVVVEEKPVQIWNEYSARLKAVEIAEIRPQVSGKITEIRFEDGQHVEKDDILYVIDPRPYEAAYNQAIAQVNVAKNQASLTWKELKRAKELIKTNAISERILDERSSAHSVAAASVKAMEAIAERAKIDLDYAYVKAPISGRVSRAEIKVGNLVQSGPSAPLLTSIVSTEGMHADFDVDEYSYLTNIRESAKDKEAESNIPVRLMLGADGSEYDGFIDSFDNQIDASSGTIRARAYFPNKDGALLPGMFASVKMGTPKKQDQILIDEKAIGTDQSRKFVYVVNEANKVEYRSIELGQSFNGKRVIKDGLKTGDKVIVDGVIRIRPGMSVDPKIQAGNDSETMAEEPPSSSDAPENQIPE